MTICSLLHLARVLCAWPLSPAISKFQAPLGISIAGNWRWESESAWGITGPIQWARMPRLWAPFSVPRSYISKTWISPPPPSAPSPPPYLLSSYTVAKVMFQTQYYPVPPSEWSHLRLPHCVHMHTHAQKYTCVCTHTYIGLPTWR